MNRAAWLSAFATVMVIAASHPQTASADLPAGVHYDETFAWFEINNAGTMTNNQPEERWTLYGRFRLLGDGIPDGSAWRVVVKKGSRTVATETVPGSWSHNTREFRPGNAPDAYSGQLMGSNTDHYISDDGEFTVELHFINDDDDSVTLVHTHTLDVRKVSRVRGTGEPAPSEFIINRHGETSVMLIEAVPKDNRHHLRDYGNRGNANHQNQVVISYNRSFTESVVGGGLRLRCKVDGERVRAERDGVERADSNLLDVHVSELRVGNEREHIHFMRGTFALPITWNTGDYTMVNGAIDMGQHPGRWECQIRTEDRVVIREFAFTVTGPGEIAPHPEELAGLRTPYGRVHLAETRVGGEGNEFDQRTDSTARTAFYGRAWVSPEGQAMAGAVPQNGEAFQPSARARRGRRGRSSRRSRRRGR